MSSVLVVSSIGFCIISIFAIAIIYDIAKKAIKRCINGKDESEHTSIDIVAMVYIDLFLILTHMILITYNFLFSSNDLECKWITKSCIIVYHLTRCIMYLIFLRRIQVIYKDTMFELSKLHTYILYGVIAAYAIPYILYMNWSLFNTSFHPKFGCLIQYEKSMAICIFFIVSTLDILIIIYCLYLFIYPMYRLIANQTDKQISCKLYSVMIKYSILYSSSILSISIFILMSQILSFGFNYSIIDDLVNGMILILLHPIHNKLYKKVICYLLHSCCVIICDAPNDDEPKVTPKQLDIILNNDTQKQTDGKMSKFTHNQSKKNNTKQIVTKINVAIEATNIIKKPAFDPQEDEIDIPQNPKTDGLRINVEDDAPESPQDVAVVDVIMEDKENEYVYSPDIGSLNIDSLMSPKGVDFDPFGSKLEFDKTKSNTLKFINFESNNI